MSTPRVWGMGARTPWLCVGACVEGVGGGEMKRERGEETAGMSIRSYNL